MKIVDTKTGTKYTVLSYIRTGEEEIIYAEGWSGYHIISIDCIFETDAKCECTSDETTGWTEFRYCNTCGKILSEL